MPTNQTTLKGATRGSSYIYVGAVGVSAGLFGFIVMTLLGVRYLQGEALEAFGVTWFYFGGPLLLISTALSVSVSKAYLTASSSFRRSAIFLSNVVAVAAMSLIVPLLLVLAKGAS